MSFRIPSRRLVHPARPLTALSAPTSALVLPYRTRRSLTQSPISQARSEFSEDDYAKENPIMDRLSKAQQEMKAKRKAQNEARPTLESGKLPTDTIFGDESMKPIKSKDEAAIPLDQRNKELLNLKLDPNPELRRRFEQKMVIRTIRKRGRMTKDEKLMRTERQHLYKSPFLATSVKKLTKLANQIAGKRIEDAMVQMRFSKKKVARDVLQGLKIARDEATVKMGMGLARGEAKGKPLEIELKDGKRQVVDDRSQIYIDQAWVGKGDELKEPEFRARGQVNMLTHRTTSFTVLLKEEATRVRISDEIRKKRANRKLWVQLPDRPVTAQRQYCLW